MCRDINNGSRRCPCDTSEARRLRRQNAAARGSYAALATKPVEAKVLPPVVPAEPFTVESVRDDIQILKTLAEDLRSEGADGNEVFRVHDKVLNMIGAGIEYLAEEKFGAPKDEALRQAVEDAKTVAELEAEERKSAARIRVKELEEEEEALRVKLSEYADNKTHPIIKERWAVWAEKDPESYAAWKAKDGETREARNAIYNNYGKIQDDINAVRRPLLEKRNEAMRQALQEVGVQFADPDSIEYSDDSHNDAVKSLKNALSFYPQSWVDGSNAMHKNRPLRIKRSKGRAHYSAGREQKTFSMTTRAYVTSKPADWIPDPHDRQDSEYVDMNGTDEWTDPKSGIVHSAYFRNAENQKAWLKISYDYWKKSTPPPKNSDWEKVEFHEEKYVPGEGFIKTGNMETHYRKPATRRSNKGSTYKAEITVSKDGNVYVGDDAGMRVAMHEFAHRVENTSPKITAYEDAFLKRRSGHLQAEAGVEVEPEKLTAIYSGKKEYGYKDNFPSHYMGKVYSGSSYREILSMGMESVFAGTNGGFVGMDNHTPDPDYKKFILGVLASAAK